MPEHRLALKLEEKYGTEKGIRSTKIASLGNRMDSIPYFNAGCALGRMENDGMLVKTKKGEHANDYPNYKLVDDWDEDVDREEIRRDMARHDPNKEPKQDTFAAF